MDNDDLSIFKKIDDLIKNNEIILFMKGTTDAPRCGFSAKVVNILNILKTKFTAVDVLEDEDMRQGIKQYSDWPTIPQLYIRGEFIGGCDIVSTMYERGEMQSAIDNTNNKS